MVKVQNGRVCISYVFSLRKFGYVVVIDTNPLDLVMEVASVILSFSCEERRGEERRGEERRGEERREGGYTGELY